MIGATEGAVDDCVRLALRETAAGRRFTDPARVTRDLALVELMLDSLRRQMPPAVLPAGPLVLAGHETDGRAHRAIVCDTRRLGDGRDLAWVGFFAVRRRDVDPAPLAVRDDELIQEFSGPSGRPELQLARARRRGLGQPDPARRRRGARALAGQRAPCRRGPGSRAPPLHRRAAPPRGAAGGRPRWREAGSAPDEVLRLSRRRRLAGGARVAALRTGRGRRAPG